MKKDAAAENDARFYQQMQQSLLYHQFLLADKVRNETFYEALRRTVTPETRVLDIGSGSGVWAIAAAKLGAKSVTAIEENETMIPIIMAHAAENGVDDRVTIITGSSFDVELEDKFDVIVSETIGNQAFEENIVTTMADARDRFLADGGILIPRKVALRAAPAHLSEEITTAAGVPVTTGYLDKLALNVTGKVANKEHVELLGEPANLVAVDLRECGPDANLSGMSAEWNLEDLKHANCVALWAECELLDGLVLDAWKTSNWMPVVCRFRPSDEASGTLRFGLNIDSKLYHWSVSVNSGPAQAYTPIFAYTKLKLDSQRAPEGETRKVEG